MTHTVGMSVRADELKVGDLALFRPAGAMEEVLDVSVENNLVTVLSETIAGSLKYNTLYDEDPVRIERQES